MTEYTTFGWRDIDLSTPKGLRVLDQVISKYTGGTGNCVNCFYTTDISQAIELLGDGVDYDYTPRLVRMLGSVGHFWKCVILPNKGDGQEFEAIHENPALAICLAWLEYMDAPK